VLIRGRIALTWKDGLNALVVEGIEAIVFRTVGDQCSLWESILPEQLQRLPEELARVDALLDDEAFFAPFVPFFDPRIGRPSTPMETYLRLMFLKFRYRLGYESLCREVADSITWRRFCRIPLDGAVAHPTTLMKLTTRCGSAAIDGLNEALLAKAAEAKLLRTNRVRADTTVVAANAAYPTDSGLLAKAIRRIGATAKRIQAAGGATRTRLRDRSRAAGKRAHAIASKLRSRAALGRDEAKSAVLTSTGELAELAQTATREAQRLLVNAQQAVRRAKAKAVELRARGGCDAAAGRRRGRLVRAVNDLHKLTCTNCWMPPDKSWSRLGSDWQGRPPMGQPGGSACTTPMPARSPRAGWGGRSNSATKPRSSTMTTGSCSTTASSRETPPTHRNWPRQCSESKSAPGARRAPSPPTAATAKPRSINSSPTSASTMS